MKSLIVTIDPFDALKIASLGLSNVSALLGLSMTEKQEEQLKKFKYILLFHKEPDNIAKRLYPNSFVKAPALLKPLKEMSDQELMNIIKPSP